MSDIVRVVDQGGNVFRTTPKDVEYYLARGFRVATEKDLSDYRQRNKPAQAFGEAAAAGLVDTTTLPFRLGLAGSEAILQNALPAVGASPAQVQEAIAGPRDLRQGLGGRATLKALAGLTAEARGTEVGEQPELEYQQAARSRAQKNPTAAALGYTAGQLPVALATPVAKGAAVVGQAAGEGFLYGAAGSGENAFLRGEDEVTAEHMLADGFVGSILGGGIGLGIHGATSATKGITKGISSLFQRVETRALEEAGEEAGKSAYRSAALPDAEDMASVMSRASGEDIDPGLASAIYNEYVAKNLARGAEFMTGADRKFMEQAIGAGEQSSKIRQTISNPEHYRQQNSQQFFSAMTNHRDAFDAITEVSRNMGVKAEAWKKLIPSELDETARAAARKEASVLLRELDRVAPRVRAEVAASSLSLKLKSKGMREESRSWFRDLYEGRDPNQVASSQKPVLIDIMRDGTSHFVDGRHRYEAAMQFGADSIPAVIRRRGPRGGILSEQTVDLLNGRSPGARPSADDLEILGRNSKTWNGVYSQVSRAASDIAESSRRRGAAAQSMVELDGVKRMLQNNVLELRSRAAKLKDVGQDYVPMLQLADHLESVQERTRTFLEREDIWGRGGRAQQRINAGWSSMLNPENEARMGMAGMLQRTGKQYQSGRWQYRITENGVDSFLGQVGKKSGGQRHLDMVRQLDAERDIVDAIGDSLGRDSAEFRRFTDADNELRRVMGDTIQRSEWLNKADAIRAASGSGPGVVTSGLIGSMVGGPVGMVGAGLMNLVSHPDRLIRMAVGVESSMKRVDKVINGHLGRMFERAGGKAPRIAEAVEAVSGMSTDRARGGSAGVSKVAVPAATRLFMGRYKSRSDAYKARSEEVVELTENADKRHALLASSGRDAASPAQAVQVAMKQSAGLAFLGSKLPTSVRMQNSLTPHLDRSTVSESEIDSFSRYWSAVVSPMSVLEDLEKGRATAEQIEALQTVYPMLYWRIRQRMLYMFANAKERPPYKVRMSADLLLNLNGQAEPTMAPDFLQRQIQRLQELQNQKPPSPPPRGVAPNLAKRYESPMGLNTLET